MESIKPARLRLRVIDSLLSLAERHLAVQEFWNFLSQYDLMPLERIIPLREKGQGDTLYGLDLHIPELDQVEGWIQAISICLDNFRVSKRWPVDQINIRLTCAIEKTTIQMETASGEELLSLLAVTNTILPAHQLFQARAKLYAQREGEFSPIELENLELLRHQLQLSPETAERFKNHALGPYQDREAKLNRYQELLKAELERQYPLSENTEAELNRFRAALGLSSDAIKPMRAEEEALYQTPEEQPEVSEPEETPEKPPTQTEEPSPQEKLAIQQAHAEQYRQEFAGAIARSPYPSEFDRGRLEQARRTWQLDREMVRAIERDVTDERYGPIDSALGLDYTRLRQLLWLNHWEAADQETERLILSALSQDMRPLTEDAMLSLSQYCIDVQTINRLWAKYSKGKFGFAAQQQVYLQQDRQPGNFLTAVEWVESVGVGSIDLLVRRKAYHKLQFHLQAPTGHLPTWRWLVNSLEDDYAISEDIAQKMLQDLIEKCLPQLKKDISPASFEASDSQS